MATLTLTGNAATLQRLVQSMLGATCAAADNRNITIVLDDSDFSVQYTDGVYGTQKKAHK